MKPITIRQIRQAVGGKFLAPVPEDAPLVSSVSNDSRRLEPSSLYVAIRGDRFDGYAFLSDAAGKGAVAALVETENVENLPNVHLILVPDARKAMGKLARYVRQQMRAKVIGVAGSNGKTSTKYLINDVLSAKLKGTASPKSFNNDIGVPLTLFPADPMQDFIVLEMGTNHHGEIRVLTEMAQPDIAVITNCGADHLEFLDDVMGVRRENATIIDGLNPNGLLVVNGDDEEVLVAIASYPGKRVTFGFKPTNDLFATDIECIETGVHFKLNGRRDVFVPLLGKHTAANALATIAVARRMGLSEEEIITSLATARGPEMRLQMQKIGGVTLINDAYNANPNSVRAALETVKLLPSHGRRIAVLGDMLELGRSNDRYHKEIGEFAAACGINALLCVGANAEIMATAAERAGMTSNAVSRHADSTSAADSITQWLTDGDLVLIKGSRGVHLETVAEAIVIRIGGHTRKLAS